MLSAATSSLMRRNRSSLCREAAGTLASSGRSGGLPCVGCTCDRRFSTQQVDVAAAAVLASSKEFYKRDLPSGCIPFDCAEGKRLFADALADGTMECFFPLAAQFRTRKLPRTWWWGCDELGC